MKKRKQPRVLVLDIETAPILASVWSIWEQNVGLNQIERDWFILAFAAKWLGEPSSKIIYRDQRKARHIENDLDLLKAVWKLMDEADAIITHNGKAFDIKKLNARFILNGMPPPSPSKQIDTKVLAASTAAFTSNKLEYLTNKLCKKYKKLKHAKFSGFELWKQCLLGNKAAWDEMEKYNKYDVLSLEELYHVLAPWDKRGLDPNLYHDGDDLVCRCGSTQFTKKGFHYTTAGKYQQYKCSECGAWTHGKENLLSISKRKSLRRQI